jgi:hypothetical protein
MNIYKVEVTTDDGRHVVTKNTTVVRDPITEEEDIVFSFGDLKYQFNFLDGTHVYEDGVRVYYIPEFDASNDNDEETTYTFIDQDYTYKIFSA